MKIDEIVAGLEPPRYTTSQASELIGRSKETLRRWKREILRPSDRQMFGSLEVSLYTPEDIERGKEIARTLKAGRKRINK